jgi:hypothetical protein
MEGHGNALVLAARVGMPNGRENCRPTAAPAIAIARPMETTNKRACLLLENLDVDSLLNNPPTTAGTHPGRGQASEGSRAGLIFPTDTRDAAHAATPKLDCVRDSQIPLLSPAYPFEQHNPTFAGRTRSVSIPVEQAVQT